MEIRIRREDFINLQKVMKKFDYSDDVSVVNDVDFLIKDKELFIYLRGVFGDGLMSVPVEKLSEDAFSFSISGAIIMNTIINAGDVDLLLNEDGIIIRNSDYRWYYQQNYKKLGSVDILDLFKEYFKKEGVLFSDKFFDVMGLGVDILKVGSEHDYCVIKDKRMYVTNRLELLIADVDENVDVVVDSVIYDLHEILKKVEYLGEDGDYMLYRFNDMFIVRVVPHLDVLDVSSLQGFIKMRGNKRFVVDGQVIADVVSIFKGNINDVVVFDIENKVIKFNPMFSSFYYGKKENIDFKDVKGINELKLYYDIVKRILKIYEGEIKVEINDEGVCKIDKDGKIYIFKMIGDDEDEV